MSPKCGRQQMGLDVNLIYKKEALHSRLPAQVVLIGAYAADSSIDKAPQLL